MATAVYNPEVVFADVFPLWVEEVDGVDGGCVAEDESEHAAAEQAKTSPSRTSVHPTEGKVQLVGELHPSACVTSVQLSPALKT